MQQMSYFCISKLTKKIYCITLKNSKMKKVLSFFGCTLFVAAMTISCGSKNQEAANENLEDTIMEAVEEVAPEMSEADQQAMLAAAAEAGQKICDCTKGDATSIENCMTSILEAGYAEYQGNEEFAAAVRAEIDNCIKDKATAAAKEAGDKAVKEGAKAIANQIKK